MEEQGKEKKNMKRKMKMAGKKSPGNEEIAKTHKRK